jgi:hypothetical protein
VTDDATRRRAQDEAERAVREGRIKDADRGGYVRGWMTADKILKRGKKR